MFLKLLIREKSLKGQNLYELEERFGKFREIKDLEFWWRGRHVKEIRDNGYVAKDGLGNSEFRVWVKGKRNWRD